MAWPALTCRSSQSREFTEVAKPAELHRCRPSSPRRRTGPLSPPSLGGRHRLAVSGLGVPIAFPAVALDRFLTAAILESDELSQRASVYWTTSYAMEKFLRNEPKHGCATLRTDGALGESVAQTEADNDPLDRRNEPTCDPLTPRSCLSGTGSELAVASRRSGESYWGSRDALIALNVWSVALHLDRNLRIWRKWRQRR
jgi:hypothetical protein